LCTTNRRLRTKKCHQNPPISLFCLSSTRISKVLCAPWCILANIDGILKEPYLIKAEPNYCLCRDNFVIKRFNMKLCPQNILFLFFKMAAAWKWSITWVRLWHSFYFLLHQFLFLKVSNKCSPHSAMCLLWLLTMKTNVEGNAKLYNIFVCICINSLCFFPWVGKVLILIINIRKLQTSCYPALLRYLVV
jgi:hypothetical protein